MSADVRFISFQPKDGWIRPFIESLVREFTDDILVSLTIMILPIERLERLRRGHIKSLEVISR